MKKLIFIFVAMMAFGFVSCSKKQASSKLPTADTAAVDTTTVDSNSVDSLH